MHLSYFLSGGKHLLPLRAPPYTSIVVQGPHGWFLECGNGTYCWIPVPEAEALWQMAAFFCYSYLRFPSVLGEECVAHSASWLPHPFVQRLQLLTLHAISNGCNFTGTWTKV